MFIQMIRNKLEKKTGASISFALAFFLVAAMVCSTILAASVSAVKRTNDEKERQQVQLTLESCARQLAKGLEGTKGTVTETWSKDAKSATFENASGDLAGVVSPALTSAVNGFRYESGDKLRITLEGGSAATGAMLLHREESPVIKVSYTMEPLSASISTDTEDEAALHPYEMVFTLGMYLDGEGTDKPPAYQAFMRVHVSEKIIVETHNDDGSQITYNKEITWGSAEISTF